MKPTLSVLVLNYNYGRFLKGCLESILAQSFADFELIVLDDCSQDDSHAVVRPFLSDPRVRFVPHANNSGFQRSLLEGTEELSHGEFLTVISADDYVCRPDAFARQIELLRRHSTTAFCFSAVQIETPLGTSIDRSFDEEVALEPARAIRAIFDQVARPPASGTIMRASSYRAVGGYRRDIHMALDLGLWVALAIEGGFAYVPDALYAYRIHAGQMSTALAGIRKNAREVRTILQDGWQAAHSRGLEFGGWTSRELFVKHFEAHAIHEAFHRDRQLVGYRLWATLAETPREALRSRKLWIAAARAALGPVGFEGLKRGLGVLGRLG